MKVLRIIRDYFCNCGISNEEYKAVRKDAYVSNFNVWRILHYLMVLVFGFLFFYSLFGNILSMNKWAYLVGFIYSIFASVIFIFLNKRSMIAQLVIYLSISVLFLCGCFLTLNNPTSPATTFVVMLLITPMFMIDRPFYMAIELICASVIYLLWMYNVKEFAIWQMDLTNIIIYCFVGIFIHIISNSLRIKGFVLTRQISIQKDLDDMTGLKNKSALTRGINEFLKDKSKDKGILFMMDIDFFKSINDTYGHDVGDDVISQVGHYLGHKYTGDEIVGRFGGDEFIVFIKNNDNQEFAVQLANEMVDGVANEIVLPNKESRLSISMGICVYHGKENNYSEIFKKADVALYKIKAEHKLHYCIYEEQ